MAVEPSVENVVGRVSEDAAREMLALLEDGLKEAEALLGAARRESAEAVSKILEAKDRQAEAARRRIVGNAEIAGRNLTLRLVEETANRAFDAALQKISKMDGTGTYEEGLRRVLEEGISALAVKDVLCSSNERDLRVLKKLAPEVGRQMKVKIEVDPTPISSAGGVKVRSAEGTVVYDNTMEARLARSRPLLRRQVYEQLVGRR